MNGVNVNQIEIETLGMRVNQIPDETQMAIMKENR